MTRQHILALIVAACTAVQLLQMRLPEAQGSGQRSIVVIGDLHMGSGRDAAGVWRREEDFRWSAEFSRFLETVDGQGGSAVDLVLNGDSFDLLASSLGACAPAAPQSGCTEAEALQRFELVANAHGSELKALDRFVRRGANRIVFVPGDRDAAILLPSIERRLLSAIGAPVGRVAVARTGLWTSADGRVVAEHGHQIGTSDWRVERWPSPLGIGADSNRLVRTPGEALVQPLYDRLEPSFPIVDNMAAGDIGLKFALAASKDDIGDLTASLLRHLLLATPWQQFRMELDDGEVKAPEWDLAQVRSMGPAFLVTALPEDDRFKPIAARALGAGQLTAVQQGLSDEELRAICDYRAAVRRARRRFEPFLSQLDPRGPIVAECPRTAESRGAVFDYFWQSRDDTFLRHVRSLERARPAQAPPIAVLVHGHTHLPDRAQSNANMISGGLLKIPMEGFSPERGALTPVAINGGAWQRTITPVQFERLARQRNVPESDLLASLQPEDLSPCYGFVHIAPYADAPSAAVRYWRQSGGGGWEIAAACGN